MKKLFDFLTFPEIFFLRVLYSIYWSEDYNTKNKFENFKAKKKGNSPKNIFKCNCYKNCKDEILKV